MKNFGVFLISIFLTVSLFGQNQLTVKVEKDETSPRFIGSEYVVFPLEKANAASINQYLSENIVCPERVIECLIEGTEIVQFEVNPCGNVSNFKVINSVCPELDEEVINVLQTTNGLWYPGLINGKPVAMDVEIVFMFGIDQSESQMVEHFIENATKCFISGSKHLCLKNNPEKALRCFNNGIKYMPNDKALLLMRGLCHYELGNLESALRDWNRIVTLGGILPKEVEARITNLNGSE